jgi:predicted AlkP superfamily pyrophosphatase or phosphodiesterase
MMSSCGRLAVISTLFVCAGLASAKEREVKLVVQITVDQLRGDTMTRFDDHFVKGGFRYFLDKGIHYTNAHYPHANTETAPGHATLATGAYPSGHGIVANEWFDAATGEFVYNTEDTDHAYIGSEPKANQGVSPRNLLASTTSDELVMSNAGRSRAFSVSPKDRGAILPGGHAGKAFWFNKRDGGFVSSTFYYDDYPGWVKDWNAQGLADRYKGQAWSLIDEPANYIARDIDDRPYESEFGGLGRTFPHPLGDGSSKYFYVLLYVTPMADELALDFAKTMLDAEQLGQKGETDYLAVSFSSPDMAGHLFGQSSLEYEDSVLRTDRNIADLLAHIDQSVGLKNTLIVLSADHGGAEAPEYAESMGIPAGRYPLDWIRTQNPLGPALKKRFGRDDLIANHSHPYVYLNLEAIDEADLNIAEVERFVAEEFTKYPGIVFGLTRTDILNGNIPDTPMTRRMLHGFHPTRSGNVHLVQQQYWFFHSTKEAEQLGIDNLAAIHGSPWNYDTHVPILFAGPGIPNMKVSRRVSPNDIAPTLTNYLGVKAPSAAVGNVLAEVVDH